ncbi:hypothetical protein V6N13_132593 [Hibiscus sabdariffa]|uniref:Uncharacterized protein n=1 Tax=Hibiscus sabdariffa TaxID=183260 RepID=A0ABR2PW92_9ROSI
MPQHIPRHIKQQNHDSWPSAACLNKAPPKAVQPSLYYLHVCRIHEGKDRELLALICPIQTSPNTNFWGLILLSVFIFSIKARKGLQTKLQTLHLRPKAVQKQHR